MAKYLQNWNMILNMAGNQKKRKGKKKRKVVIKSGSTVSHFLMHPWVLIVLPHYLSVSSWLHMNPQSIWQFSLGIQ